MRAGYNELDVTISYPTRATGMIVLLKTPEEIPENQLKSITKIMHTPNISVVNGI